MESVPDSAVGEQSCELDIDKSTEDTQCVLQLHMFLMHHMSDEGRTDVILELAVGDC